MYSDEEFRQIFEDDKWQVSEAIKGQVYLYPLIDYDYLVVKDYKGYIRFAALSDKEIALTGIDELDFLTILILRMEFLQTTEYASISLTLIIWLLKLIKELWVRI